MKLKEEEINFLCQFFARQPVKKAYIFGSYARSESNLDSDLDILVELDYSKHIGLRFLEMKEEIEEALKKKIDLVSTHGVSPLLLPFIDADKKLIYER
ncbi:MAG: nucleotidyltransferase domain-containing protein [Cyclobacteriaceae bacterium]|nr:nucleotidyltransferase domain-containing protein [Cyclobacteriaceae bacterium]